MVFQTGWSEAEIARVAKLWNDGLSGGAIAKIISAEFSTARSRSSIMGAINRNPQLFTRRHHSKGRALTARDKANIVKRAPKAVEHKPRPVELLSHEVAFAAEMWNRKQAIERIAEVVSERFGKAVNATAIRKLIAERPKLFKERGRGALMRGGRNPHHAANQARAGAPVDDYRPVATRDDARAYDAASRRLPLPDLDWGDCRFPVNEAARGETHLFCGRPALSDKVRYCAHHAARVVGKGTEGERAAERILKHEAKRAA